MKDELLEIYEQLLDYFGAQNWWPADSPFEMIVGAILTQNTSWENTSRAITNLKSNRLMSPSELSSVPDTDLEELIRPTGYYRQKTKRLKNFLTYLNVTYNGNLWNLFKLDIVEMRHALLSINGIGQETADSIILYGAGKPTFVIDKYTVRIFTRIGFLEETVGYDAAKAFFEENLPHEVCLFNEYHALIVALGNSVCKKSAPNCPRCPISNKCKTGALYQ